MLEYGELMGKVQELEAEIRAAVLEREETQIVGNVKAAYSGGRKSYDYEAAVNKAMQSGLYPVDLMDTYTSAVVKTDWRRAALEGIGIEQTDVPYTESEPSVRVSLV
jgi:hypothetical protein